MLLLLLLLLLPTHPSRRPLQPLLTRQKAE
jgi:hypothetical protein